MNKIDYFNKEYTYIKNNKYRENLKIMVNLLPDHFFEVPASSTGKYHPEFSLGDGGLLRHTKAAAKIAYEFYNDEPITGIFNQNEKDLMIFALILHDGLKSGLEKSQYTLVDHPLLISNYIKDNKDKLTITKGEIEFMNVTFNYGQEHALNNVSFHIYQGQKIGIIGSTGSSKTTLVQLIPRLYEASKGEVLVGGRNVKEYRMDWISETAKYSLKEKYGYLKSMFLSQL